MRKQIYANYERCMNCQGCEVACQRENGGLRFINVVMIADRFAVPLTCRHCDPAPCAIACPPGALSFGDDGLKLEAAKCTGCTLCEFACPFGMMNFHPQTKKAASCDLCAGRQAEGNGPACMLTCPSSALHYGDYASYAARERRRASAQIMRAQPQRGG